MLMYGTLKNQLCSLLSALCLCVSLVFFAVILVGCESKSLHAVQASDVSSDEEPSRSPTSEDMRKITALEYSASPDARFECLGRIMFEVSDKVEWPTFYQEDYSDAIFNRLFAPFVADPGDNIRYDGTLIAVIADRGKAKSHMVFDELPASAIKILRKKIQDSRSFIVRLKNEPGDSNNDIGLEERNIARWEGMIKDYQNKFENFDVGLPESEGYWTSRASSADKSQRYSVLRAYLSRNGHIFVFESLKEMKTTVDKDEHKRDFLSMLKRFRPRQLGEIPKDRGVCIPFGFIADSGTTKITFKQSLRFADAPGVLFTLNTGTVTSRNLKVTPLLATAEAMIKPPPGDTDPAAYKLIERIGPRTVKMGGLTASQGGVVYKASAPKQKVYDVYTVFNGYGGWLGSPVLPYILLNMHTVNREVATELPAPPPFALSNERMNRMLKTMRWRPTEPPMPEFSKK